MTSGSGMYRMSPRGRSVEAYCDFTSDGGGWTVSSVKYVTHLMLVFN